MYQITNNGMKIHCNTGATPVPISGRRGMVNWPLFRPDTWA